MIVRDLVCKKNNGWIALALMLISTKMELRERESAKWFRYAFILMFVFMLAFVFLFLIVFM